MFFVISGYVIAMYVSRYDQWDLSFILNYLKNRIKRIIPLYFFAIGVTFFVSIYIFLPGELLDLTKSLKPTLLFYSNIYFSKNQNYFDELSKENPFLHTWSLSLEMQFYFIFIIMMILIAKFKLNLKYTLLLVILTSLILSQIILLHNPDKAFYLLISRYWEFLVGSISYIFFKKTRRVFDDALVAFGFFLIIAALNMLSIDSNFPGLAALLPTIGTALIISFATNQKLLYLLGNPFMSYIGRISYSLYIWHWIIFVLAKKVIVDLNNLDYGFLILASLLISILSYQLIEIPFRSERISFFALVSIYITLLFVFIGLDSKREDLIEKSMDHHLKKYSSETTHYQKILLNPERADINYYESNFEKKDCRFLETELNEEVIDRIKVCSIKYGAGTLILGDSHAMDLFGSVLFRFDEDFLVAIARGGCRPHDELSSCQYQEVLRLTEKQPKLFKHIIFEQAAFYLFLDPNGSPATRESFQSLYHEDSVQDFTVNDTNIKKIKNYLEKLSMNTPVTWFLPRIEPHFDKRLVLDFGCDFEWNLRPGTQEIYSDLDMYIKEEISKSTEHAIKTVSQIEVFGFDFPKDFFNCETIYWNDGDHYSTTGEIYFSLKLPQSFLTW